MKINSIKGQLRRWLLLPMLLVLTISAAVSYYRAYQFANLAYDRALYRTAQALADEILVNEDNTVVLHLPQVASNLLKYDDGDQVFYRIQSPDGKLVAGDADLMMPAIRPGGGEHRYFGGESRGQRVRGVIYALPMSENPAEGDILIMLAETTSKREALVIEIMEELLLPQLLIMLLASLVIEFGIRHALIQMQETTNAIHDRNHRDLSPIHPQTPVKEIQPLIDALNGLLDRVRQGILQQQQFIADASHQMRTPIAGLQTMAELALRESNTPAQQELLSMLSQSAQRLSHLINGLLTLAKAESTINDDAPHQAVSLKTVIVEVCERLIGAASEKHIDLEVEVESHNDQVIGEPILLGEMLTNLVENAIHYSPTHSLILISLLENDGALCLKVADSGIGIPAANRNQIFKRFYRLQPNLGNGCGLGLAIVNEIATWHGARIEVTDGLKHPVSGQVGICFSVVFPVAATTAMSLSA